MYQYYLVFSYLWQINNTLVKLTKSKELKRLLMKVKEESGKSWLNTQHSENKDHGMWSHHLTANRWGKMETVADFILGGSKITADGDCSH